MLLYVAYAVLFLSFINLFRLVFFSIGSDLYDIRNLRFGLNSNNIFKIKKSRFDNKRYKSKNYFSKRYYPLVTIIVPAHNEERVLKRNLLSIINSTYKNVELIIVNDSSTDKTKQIALNFQHRYKNNLKGIKVINVNVRGKAKAMNKGLKYAHGSLFMCLDADSALTPNALKNAVEFFREKSVGALASNVKIIPGKGMLNLLQRIEYAINYQMKKAEALARIQYIVGGIGSMYRMKIIRDMGYYDTDTITEDIDLSMKMILTYKNKRYIAYDPSMVVFSEAALTISDLLKQCNRWKYGRYQVFLKRQALFYSKDKGIGRLLSWFYLPYALFAELSFALEPITIAYIFYLIFAYGDFSTILGSVFTFCFYTIIEVTGATQAYSFKERLKFAALAPFAYILIYILSFVEYVATIKGFLSIKKLLDGYKTGVGGCEWSHVERTGETIAS